ncbi:hypothetical protein LTR91_006278 [Friedmanniomyces endolithicus]|uniref:NmrA-like domain-containing protein n=2 Tax=Friedmanniomyces endolithicus TaxID=329885 RepID=A0AAN6KRY1_9PEZI|nr:hypothetical protein LTS09_007349 [Friedmanniomyces endolithicus]KAK0294071.1 hypothetical protein LTS00_007411 [Friedmanniomyces endolithicus]KAK0308502.1 hypothetical protein LTR01_005130 [Friedmanniomyces endolithicus]KAK0824583.1 hypothetical protein LTR73_007632 [Friedmanniomyces endolithicus]KAK0929033.1 hypothetical protein LTR57_002107 [Friedmanniomyces endolithicus]
MSPSTPIKRVVLVGATGAVGAPVLQTLLDQHFYVTVFTRASSNHSFPSNVHVANVDYEDVAGMTKALQGQDALISTIGFGGATLQMKLLDAAIAAGVKRFLPSEFGCDTHNPRVAAIPLFRTKLDIDEYMDEKVKGTGTTYTCVYTNAFLDWGLVNNGLLLDLPGKKVQMIDGGNTPFTANSLDFIAKGTVAVLKHLNETANRAIRLNGAVVTLNQVLGYAKKYAGAEGWEVTGVTTEALEQEGMKNFKAKPEDLSGYMMQFIKLAIYGPDFGGNFDSNNDNALLGLKKMSDEEVEQLVKGVVKRVACRTRLVHVPGDRVAGPWRWVHARPSDQERARALARITAPLAHLPLFEVPDSPPRSPSARRRARPSRRADSATTRAGTVSSLSSSLAASAASREYRSALSEDNVRQAMEALTLGEKRDSERRVRFQATGSEDRLRGPVGGGQSGCGQAMVEARERVRAGKEEAEEWEVVEEEEQEEEQEEEEHEQESSDEESTDDESSDDEEWVLESDGMVVAQVVEFV